MQDVISLPDVTSYDKINVFIFFGSLVVGLSLSDNQLRTQVFFQHDLLKDKTCCTQNGTISSALLQLIKYIYNHATTRLANR